MEETITKFMRSMEVRSASMLRFIKDFTEWYRKESHIHVELTDASLVPKDYNIYNLHFQIYDDVSIKEYGSGALRGHHLLRLVNSNLYKVSEILEDILRYYTLGSLDRVKEKGRRLSNLLGIYVHDDEIFLSPAFLYDLLSSASDMMKGPTKYFNGAGCYSISGVRGMSSYMDELNRIRSNLSNDNEYKIAKAFFEYLKTR